VVNSIDLEYIRYVLNEAYERLKDVYLISSALGPVRLYAAADIVDKEFWTLFCALVDFQIPVQRVLNPMLTGLVEYMERNGLKFIDLIFDKELAEKVFNTFSWSSKRGVRRGFTHRFVKIVDLILLLNIFKRIIEEYGSLNAPIKEAYSKAINEVEPMEHVFKEVVSLFAHYGGKPPLTPVRFGSALKRLALFTRWMVRPYPDLGLWNFIDKKHLVISLDEGLRRILLRAFSMNVSMNWRGVLKATRFLRKINPSDPAKYDYLLSRLSIMKYCAKEHARSRCYLCPIAKVCVSANVPIVPKSKPLTGREGKIFERFLEIYGNIIDSVSTEYPLDNYSTDALIHMVNCNNYIVEVEYELNYVAIGQVITYRYLYFKKHKKHIKPMIICMKSSKDLEEACKLEQGIEVVTIENLSNEISGRRV